MSASGWRRPEKLGTAPERAESHPPWGGWFDQPRFGSSSRKPFGSSCSTDGGAGPSRVFAHAVIELGCAEQVRAPCAGETDSSRRPVDGAGRLAVKHTSWVDSSTSKPGEDLAAGARLDYAVRCSGETAADSECVCETRPFGGRCVVMRGDLGVAVQPVAVLVEVRGGPCASRRARKSRRRSAGSRNFVVDRCWGGFPGDVGRARIRRSGCARAAVRARCRGGRGGAELLGQRAGASAEPARQLGDAVERRLRVGRRARGERRAHDVVEPLVQPARRKNNRGGEALAQGTPRWRHARPASEIEPRRLVVDSRAVARPRAGCAFF